MTRDSDADRLDSWKAIANYLGRSVRTVRRWEASEALPVRRHMHQAQGTVYALRHELDDWLASRSQHEPASRIPVAPSSSPSSEVLAVLPLDFIGPDPSQSYIADGLTDELIVALSGIHDLQVISRTSSMALRDRKGDAPALGRTLGAKYLIEGAVRTDGASLKIAVSLIEAARDKRIWSEQFSGPIDKLFDIEESISRQVVAALEMPLSPGEEARLTRHAFGNVSAWQCAAQARQSGLRWRRDAIDHAIKLLQQALELESGNAELHAMLGRTWLQYREAGIDGSEEPLLKAQQCADTIQALDPESAAGFNLRGWLAYSRGDVQGAVTYLRRALEAHWNDPDTLGVLSNCYLITGRLALAAPLIEHLLKIDPLTPLTRCLPGWSAVLSGDVDAAVDPYREMFEMDPGNPMGRMFYVWVLIVSGATTRAAEIAEGFNDPSDSLLPATVAKLLVAGSMSAENFADLPQPGIEDVPPTDIFPRLLAQANALAGQKKDAVLWLERAVALGFINYPYLADSDPVLSRLRGDSDYEALIEKVKHQWESFEA